MWKNFVDSLIFVVPLMIFGIVCIIAIMYVETDEDKAIKACKFAVEKDKGNPVASAEQLALCTERMLKAFRRD